MSPLCTAVDCGLPHGWPRFVPLWPRPDGSRPPDFEEQPHLEAFPPQTTFNNRFWFSCRLGFIPKGLSNREARCGADAEWLVGDLECVGRYSLDYPPSRHRIELNVDSTMNQH